MPQSAASDLGLYCLHRPPSPNTGLLWYFITEAKSSIKFIYFDVIYNGPAILNVGGYIVSLLSYVLVSVRCLEKISVLNLILYIGI